MLKQKLILIVVIFNFVCCSKVSPGRFWTSFRKAEIISKKFDHGPYGGMTEIHWKKSEASKGFDENEIKSYAKENDWRFIDIIYLSEIKNSSDFSFEIFKNEFSNQSLDKNSIVLRFKSNLLTINEDRNVSTDINCFAILNENKTDLIIYFRWGDF